MPKTSPATTPPEIAMVLASLKKHPRTVVDFVGDKAAAEDMPWLYGMLDAGWFDAPDFIDAFSTDATAHNPLGDSSVSTIAALHRVSERVNYEIDVGPVAALALTVTPEFGNFLRAVTDRFFETFQIRSAGLTLPSFSATGVITQVSTIKTSTAEILVQIACMVDQASVVRTAMKECPEISGFATKSQLWSDAAYLLGDSDVSPLVTMHAAVTAIAFSSHNALRALEENGLDYSQPMAYYPRHQKIEHQGDARKEVDGNAAVLSDLFAEDALRCTPDMFTYLLNKGLAPDGFFSDLDRKNLYQWSERLIEYAKTSNVHQEWVEVCIQEGVYDFHPEKSIRSAAQAGNASVIRHFQDRMPWPSLLDSSEYTFFELLVRSHEPTADLSGFFVMSAAIGTGHASSTNPEALMLEAIAWALRDGYGEQVLGANAYQREELMGPILTNEWHKTLQCYLEHGLGPETVLDSGPTLRALAEGNGHDEAVGMMLSMQSRNRALVALHEIDMERRMGKFMARP